MFNKKETDRSPYPAHYVRHQERLKSYAKKQAELEAGRGIAVDGKFLKVLAATAVAGVGLAVGSEMINTPPDHYDGKVVAKNYDDPDTTHGIMSNGRSTVPYVIHDGPHWNITVKSNDNEDSEYKNYTVEINKEQYQKLTVGEKVHVDDGVISRNNSE